MLFVVLFLFAIVNFCDGTGNPITIPSDTIFQHMSDNDLQGLTDKLADDHKFLMYIASSCPYCRNTTKMMNTKYSHLSYDYYEYDRQPGGIWLMNDIMKRNYATRLPQVYLCRKYFGGFEELQQLDKSNELETKLSAC